MFITMNEEKGYGVQLIKYNGRYSLVTCWQKDKTTWCNINYFKNGKRKFIDKPTPLGTRLGNRKLAISILRQALREIVEDVEDRT